MRCAASVGWGFLAMRFFALIFPDDQFLAGRPRAFRPWGALLLWLISWSSMWLSRLRLLSVAWAARVCCWLTLSIAHGQEAEPIARVTMKALPAVVQIHGTNRQQQLLITAQRLDGRFVDVSHQAKMEIRDPSVARIQQGVVIGVGDGETELLVTWDGAEITLPIRVSGLVGYPPVDFGNDLLPLLSKLGCNSGGCHGKASGQNGFKLSVFGFDAQADFDALVKEARGRRLFAANPESSLLLKKGTGAVPHGGGQRLKVGSIDYQMLLAWIQQGTPFEQSGSPTLVRLEANPAEQVMETGGQQQILATAHYSDGSQRDVTDGAGYASNAILIAEADRQGLIRFGQVPGEAAITVHYMGQVASVQVRVPRAEPATLFEFPPQNAIDELVVNKLRTMKLVPAELAEDSIFLRRLFLDLIGTLPSPDEVQQFLADESVNKRQIWIDRVLDRAEYADYWGLVWSDILLVDRQKLGERGAYELHHWLREQFARNRPYDRWVAELVTATGNSGTNGPANIFRAVETSEELARTFSQAFLGVRMECAQCHHHPFEKWSQDDFYGLAGFFNGIERKPIAPGRVLVYHSGLKETRIPLSSKLVPTRPLDGAIFTETGTDPRLAFSQWLVAPQNPWFSRLVANRLWKHFLGRGLVEPEDDLRSTNPPTNEPLLNLLAERVVTAKFDLKDLMRFIVNSRTYQLSSVTNTTNHDDEQNFSHHYVKRLPAEVLLDAISQVTGEPEVFPGYPPGTRAIELWDNRLPSYFLEIFGRPERTSPCECGRSSEPTMSQALHLMNAPEIETRISSPTGRIARLVNAGLEPTAIVEDLCLTTLGRHANGSDREIAEKLFQSANRQQAAEDYLWSLLNSYEFLFVK